MAEVAKKPWQKQQFSSKQIGLYHISRPLAMGPEDRNGRLPLHLVCNGADLQKELGISFFFLRSDLQLETAQLPLRCLSKESYS